MVLKQAAEIHLASVYSRIMTRGRTVSTGLLVAIVAWMLCGHSTGSVAYAVEVEAHHEFEEAFGRQFRGALSTPGTEDDRMLAITLRDLVKQYDDLTKPMGALIGDKVIQLAKLSTQDYKFALETLSLVSKTVPDLVASNDAKALDLLNYVYINTKSEATRNSAGLTLVERLNDRGKRAASMGKSKQASEDLIRALAIGRNVNSPLLESIITAIKATKIRDRVSAELDMLEKRLEENPDDIQSRLRLIHIHLVERDAPDAARWLVLVLGEDNETKRLLPFAAKNGEGANAITLVDLGSWYLKLANIASLNFKLAMLQRSKGYLRRYLDSDQATGLLKNKASSILNEVEKRIIKSQTLVAKSNTEGNTPSRPKHPSKSGALTDADLGELTVEIPGRPVTNKAVIRHNYKLYSARIAKKYIAVGDKFIPTGFYNPMFPSSENETLANAKKRLTRVVFKTSKTGALMRSIVAPVPAEAQAASMALPTIGVGHYGYVDSFKVDKIHGPNDMTVSQVWLVNTQNFIREKDAGDTVERRKLFNIQSEYSWQKSYIRIVGIPTLKMVVGQRYDKKDPRTGKKHQIAIVASEPNSVYVAVPVSSVARPKTLIPEQLRRLLEVRNLTITDFVNLALQARQASPTDYINKTVSLVESQRK